MTLARLEQSLSPCLHCPAAFPPRSCAPCPPKAAKPLDTGWGQHRNHKQSEASRRAQGWTDSVCPKAGRGDFSLPRQTGINFPADLCHGAISVLPTASKLLPGGLLPFSLANKPGVLVFLLSCFCTKEAAVGEVQGVPRCRVPMPCSLCWGMLPAPSALGQSLDPSLGHSGTAWQGSWPDPRSVCGSGAAMFHAAKRAGREGMSGILPGAGVSLARVAQTGTGSPALQGHGGGRALGAGCGERPPSPPEGPLAQGCERRAPAASPSPCPAPCSGDRASSVLSLGSALPRESPAFPAGSVPCPAARGTEKEGSPTSAEPPLGQSELP